MPSKEDWVISYDIQQAIQRVAVLTWSISNRRALKQRCAEGIAALEDARAELMTGDGIWLKVGEAYEFMENEDEANDVLESREVKMSSELTAVEELLKKEESEVENVKKLITQQLGDKVQLNME